MRIFHYREQLSPHMLDDFDLGNVSLTLDFSLEVGDHDQDTVDVCMSRIYAVIGNIFKDGIICTDGNESAEMLAAVLSNHCVELPEKLNFEILAELLYHKFHAVTDNKVQVMRITLAPDDHHFGIEFNQTSEKKCVEGYQDRWWFNPNLKFSDYDDVDLNGEIAWENIELNWPGVGLVPEDKPKDTNPVIIEFPRTR